MCVSILGFQLAALCVRRAIDHKGQNLRAGPKPSTAWPVKMQEERF